MQYSEDLSQKIEDCRELYLNHGGQNHELIEKEMRDLGYRDFHRRNLYRRFERGTCRPGWVETYGWDWLLKEQKKSSPPCLGGVADASSDGVVVQKHPDQNITDTELYMNYHPTLRAPLLNKEGSFLPNFDEFKDWLIRTWPGMKWEFRHQVYIYKHLKRVTDGDCKRLMIFMPPRHGKSELVTVRFPAWMLKQKPETKIIIGSYNQRLANRFSRMVRAALAEDAAVSVPPAVAGGLTGNPTQVDSRLPVRTSTRCEFSSKSQLQPPATAGGSDWFVHTRAKNSEAEWETPEGGGVRAVGMGAGVTGYGADLIIIDDPVKSRAEAESETIREKVWNWFNDDIYTRLQPDGKIILIQTRWHEDDLAGRLLREAAEAGGEQWEVINLPALAEVQSAGFSPSCSPNPERDKSRTLNADPLGRASGEALCPEWFDENALDRVKRKLGSYSFAALYQQRPVPAEGGLFKRAWFRTVNAAPSNLRWKRGYDLGISRNSTSDYTASLRVAYDKAGNMYIDGGFRRRIEYPEQRRFILGRIATENNTEHGIELSANGNAVIQDLRSETSTRGRALRGVKVKGDKVTNALPWIALAEEGKVFLVHGTWNSEFIDEAAGFPSGTHDDQIDAVSIAVRMHRERSGRLYMF